MRNDKADALLSDDISILESKFAYCIFQAYLLELNLKPVLETTTQQGNMRKRHIPRLGLGVLQKLGFPSEQKLQYILLLIWSRENMMFLGTKAIYKYNID